MRILLITPEPPDSSLGGIATYTRHARAAHALAGHELYLFSWRYEDGTNAVMMQVDADKRTCTIVLDGSLVWKEYPNGPYGIAFSYFLMPYIIEYANTIQPDVIESSDYLAPLYAYLMRRRSSGLGRLGDIPVLVYNHGLVREVYRTNATMPRRGAQMEAAAERSVLRWCDAALVPSEAALRTLHRHMGRLERQHLLPEPYHFSDEDRSTKPHHHRFVHLGRVSFSKGIDREIHFLNLLSASLQLDEVLFVGHISKTSFRLYDVEDYVTRRISPKLLNKIRFSGALPYTEILSKLRGGGYSMNFSLQETFSYAFLEMLDAGLLPFTIADTPMAEFYPEPCRYGILTEQLMGGSIAEAFTAMKQDDRFLDALVSHCQVRCDYAAFSSRYVELVEGVAAVPRLASSVRRTAANGLDVSILIPVYNDGAVLGEALSSIAAQTIPPKETIILNDGSSDPATLELLEEVRCTAGVRVINAKTNEGLCATRVKLIQSCRTSMSVFLDADDLLAPTFIASTLTAYRQAPDDIRAVTCLRENFHENSEKMIYFGFDDYSLFLSNNLRMTALIETQVLRELSFDVEARNGEAEDWDFWLRFRNHGYGLLCVPEFLFRYRFRNGSMSWPWSEGQTTLSADLIARRVVEAAETHRVPAMLYTDLLSGLLAAQLMPEHLGHSQLTRKLRHLEHLRTRRPSTAAVLRGVVRLVMKLAKRL